MNEQIVNTGVDLAFKLVLMNERLPVTTVARVLDLKTKYVERLFDTLERKNMVKMRYRFLKEPEVMIKRRSEVPMSMKRLKVFDWVIECPQRGRGVMFKVSCLNCGHFKDVEGKFSSRKGQYEFRPENVICTWEKQDAM